MFGKSVAAYAIVRLFGHPKTTALTISASLAQIGEFAFILAGLGVALSLLPERGRDLILAGAIISIFLNPFVFTAVAGRVGAEKERDRAAGEAKEMERQRERRDHTILVGFGRVGRLIGLDQDPAMLELAGQERFPETNVVRVFLYVYADNEALEGYTLRVTKDGAEQPVAGASFGGRRVSQVRGVPRVTVVEAHDTQVAFDERLEEAERPVHQLGDDAHHQQDCRVCRVASLLVGDVDARRPHAPRELFVQHGESSVS